MPQPEMSPEDFKAGQDALGLSDTQLTEMLGFENPQHLRRLKAPVDRGHHKRIMPATARLMRAYVDGYRPSDWPTSDAAPNVPAMAGDANVMRRLRRLEDDLAALRSEIENS